MEIKRHIERLRALEDRPEPLVVEKDAVGETVDHRALEAELGRSLELVGRRLGIAGRKRGKRCEAGRVSGDDCLEPVIDAPREINRIGAAELLRRRRAVRKDLHVDAGLIHFAQAQLADIVEALEHFRIAHTLGAHEVRRQLVVPVVLLQRDDRTFQRSQHDGTCPVG